MEWNLDFKLDDLVDFLLRARNHGYAGGAEEVSRSSQRPGFKEFASDSKVEEYLYYKYIDSYSGYYRFSGQEIIRFRGIPIWNMAYNGGMLPKFHGHLEFSRLTYLFLKEALVKVEKSRPFRGPQYFRDNAGFEYVDESEGDITNFKGTEKILFRDEEVFRQDYIGGLIIHK